jgi:DGQHR domain-containing protein
MRYSVPALRAVQNGQELFLFFLPAKALKALPIQVEKFDPDKPYDDPQQGYQRSAERNRARRFSRYLEVPDATSPTAIMLNDRDSQSSYDLKQSQLTFDTEKGPIFNYDGQHRQLGYVFRLEDDDSFAEFPIPVTMTRGMDKLNEMTQFQTINSTAKGVATGLVNAILAKVHATEGDEAIDVSQHRGVVCYKVTEALNNDPESPWHTLIALPNQTQWTKRAIGEDPTREHARVIKANSFVDVLRPVYDYLSQLKMADTLDTRAQEIATVVNEFWSALKEKMPEAFERPNDYALFKSNGVGPMHLVLRDLMVKMHSGHRKWVKAEFLVMMEGADLLSNHEFWDSENEDGARNYSGKAGWPDLAKKIIRDVEEGAPISDSGKRSIEHRRPQDEFPPFGGSSAAANGITRGPRTHLRVTLNGGTVIEEHKAADTFALALSRLGLSKVEALGIKVRNVPLIANSRSDTQFNQTKIEGKYICTHSSTKEKKETLDLVANKLGTPLTVEVIENC